MPTITIRFARRLWLCLCIVWLFGVTGIHGQAQQYKPGSVIIKLRGTPSLDRVRSILPADTTIAAAIDPRMYLLHVPTGKEQAYVAHLNALPEVMYAQLDHIVTAQVQPNDPYYAQQWNLQAIGMAQAWATQTDTSDVVIAVLDTGVKRTHPDLYDQLWRNSYEIAANGLDDDRNGYIDDVHGWHFYHVYTTGEALPRDDADISDPNGHGTHVAGIIGAAGDNGVGVTGVAWRSRLMIVRVLDDDRMGAESDVIRGLTYAINNGARVVNLSLGQMEDTPALREAITEAEARGVLLVAAAGNTGKALLYPAAYPTVLGVGASDRNGERASFSAGGAQLNLLAPGVDILSTWNGQPYFTQSGTSMAAPHVSGVAALLRQQQAEATPAHIRRCLQLTATDVAAPGRDDNSGYGIVNAARALGGCPRTILLPFIAVGTR